MKKILLTLSLCAASIAGYAQSAAQFSKDTFENFTLHTYASFDPMADVSFIVETEKDLVVIEPQAFKDKVEEFVDYTKKLNKPVKQVFVSFHAAGLKVYNNQHKVITKPMVAFMKSPRAKGMLGFFDKAFKGAMDTTVVAFDETINADAVFTIGGVTYKLEPTSVPGMPGVNIAIGNKVYYQHFAPAKGFHPSEHHITSIAAIDGTLADARKIRKAGYTLLLGSHGSGKATRKDLKFQVKYLRKMKHIATEAKNEQEFLTQMKAAFPHCKGDKDLKAIAKKMYSKS